MPGYHRLNVSHMCHFNWWTCVEAFKCQKTVAGGSSCNMIYVISDGWSTLFCLADTKSHHHYGRGTACAKYASLPKNDWKTFGARVHSASVWQQCTPWVWTSKSRQLAFWWPFSLNFLGKNCVLVIFLTLGGKHFAALWKQCPAWVWTSKLVADFGNWHSCDPFLWPFWPTIVIMIWFNFSNSNNALWYNSM